MTNTKVAKHYDALYTKDSTAFKRAPLPLVVALTQHIQTGKVLDIGAAQGDNSIFLASKGFDVHAWDISQEAIKLLYKNASDARVALDAQVRDVAKAEIVGEYDVIICTFMLHHLSQNDAPSVIKKIQNHTKRGGFNIITAFSKEGYLFAHEPSQEQFYLNNKDHLAELYKGEWEIIKCFEKEATLRMKDSSGNQINNIFVGMLTQKK